MLKGDGIVRADALAVPAADAMVLVDCHLAIGVHRDDFLRALLGAVATTRAFLVVDYRREASTAESVLYGAVRVLANVEPHAAARAAEAGGADALSLINTLTGMKIDINRRKFVLANKTGGMSGPAVKPVAVRMVYQTAQAVKLPIIGMGGIMNAEDALEFILAGATAVSVGTANFIDPMTTLKVAEGIEAYMRAQNVSDIRELVGAVQ